MLRGEAPDELEPFEPAQADKRKWDKFIVFLKVREGHDTLGGQEVRVDTYRHAHVEGWILEMERTAFPPEEGEEASPEPAGDEDPTTEGAAAS